MRELQLGENVGINVLDVAAQKVARATITPLRGVLHAVFIALHPEASDLSLKEHVHCHARAPKAAAEIHKLVSRLNSHLFDDLEYCAWQR